MNQYTSKLEKIEDAIKTFFNSLDSNAFGDMPKAVKPKHIEELKEPCTHLISQGGKRWRPLLLILCTELFAKEHKLFQNKMETAYTLCPLVELIHTASLIHDDIEDASEKRRGKPASHIKYGLDKALNAGSWLYFAALYAIETAFSKDCETQKLQYQILEYCLKDIRRLHLGQAMDILWHRNTELIPSIAEYEAMITFKTASLARLSALIGAIIGGASEKEANELSELIINIGIGFQILDDVTNLTKGNPGKKRGDDIVEGKKSYPVLLHIEKKPEDLAKIAEYFKNARIEGIDSPYVEECIRCINTSDALLEAKAKGEALIIDSCETLVYLYKSETAKEIQKLFHSMLLSE